MYIIRDDYSLVSNLFVRFNCNCWDKPSCTHGPSAATVVIGDCELAHPVDSLVDEPINSKAMKVYCIPLMYRSIDIIFYVLYVQLLDAMHKYKKAEVVYDNLDLVFCVIKLLAMISGNTDCRKKLVSANVAHVRLLMMFDYVYTECMDPQHY